MERLVRVCPSPYQLAGESPAETLLEEQRSEPETEQPSSRNRRNGHTKKTIKREFGEAEIGIPRDRASEFTPVIIKKGQIRFDGFDDKMLSLYARSIMTRDVTLELKSVVTLFSVASIRVTFAGSP